MRKCTFIYAIQMVHLENEIIVNDVIPLIQSGIFMC